MFPEKKIRDFLINRMNFFIKTKIIIDDNNTFLTIPTKNNYKNERFNILLVLDPGKPYPTTP